MISVVFVKAGDMRPWRVASYTSAAAAEQVAQRYRGQYTLKTNEIAPAVYEKDTWCVVVGPYKNEYGEVSP